MKKIVFVQVGFEFDGDAYLPYAAGTLIANCRRCGDITSEYDFPEIIFSREPLKNALRKTEGAFAVSFSCSVWNVEYNKALARLIKERDPACIIIFGGHSVAETGGMLEELPYVDILMFGEGERTMVSLLRALNGGNLGEVTDIAYRENGKTVLAPRTPAGDLTDLPSPYTTGVFDALMAANPDVHFLAVLETNRGCPYRCAYCDWVNGRKMRFFPMEKVLAEIAWLSEHKIGYCFCADSNFGMFDRDVEIADALIEAKKKTGYPEVFRPCYEKNSADRVFKICSALNSVGMDKGATMAYQTLSPDALKNIGRKNLTMEHFASLMQRYNEAGIPTYSELILGLPGETKESFARGICRLLENGQHNSLSVYHCEMLPNSDMADPAFIEKHKIEVIKVAFNHIHSAPKKHEEVTEYSYLVRSTATMPREDWVEANLFSVCVQCFHALGLLRFFAMLLHTEGVCGYYDFYTALLAFIRGGSGRLHDLWAGFQAKYETSLSGDWNSHDPRFGNVTWFFEEGAFLEVVTDYDRYLDELEPFLRRFGLENALFSELRRYQRFVLRKPGDKEETQTFAYDFPAYFDAVVRCDPVPLNKTPVTLTRQPAVSYNDPALYAKETVWFGRRRGATVYHAGELKTGR